MGDAFTVSGFEGVGDLADVVEGGFEWNGTAELYAFDEFHDDGAVFDAIDGGDVVVVQSGEDVGFAGEAGEAIRVTP